METAQGQPLSLLKTGKCLTETGISVIPTYKSKSPYTSLLPIEIDENGNPVLDLKGKPKRTWKPYQERLATDDELEAWFGPAKFIAIISGAVSGGVETLDFDCCPNAGVKGKIIGNLKVNGLLSLKQSANIEGDITTQKLAIEPGAKFTGQCKMGKGSINANQGSAKNSTPKADKEVPADDVVY